MASDVVVIGSGPNGLAAAIALAQAGLEVEVREQYASPGGGARTEALTLDGFLHDVCSAVHPLGLASPFLSTLGLERHGLSWVQPDCPLVHALSAREAVPLEKPLEVAAEALGKDGEQYARLVSPFVSRFDELMGMILGPLRFPSHPLLLARFGLAGLASAQHLMQRNFSTQQTRALFAGIAAHPMLPLSWAATGSFALVLAASAHAPGWPVARGGSQSIIRAMVALLRELGGTIRTSSPVRTFADLPAARAYVFDVSPRQLLEIAGEQLTAGYRRRLEQFRYGPGVCKVDWALDGPIPWTNATCLRAATVHLGGTAEQIAAAEAAVHAGRVSDEPFVILVQPTLFDPSRAPEGRHVAWAYCHVPNGSNFDASAAIERQIERVAPGFRDRVLARSVKTTADMQKYNPNYIGGDIGGGLASLAQLFSRPIASLDPYSTANPRIFLCSASTPPGGGVHGMCGYWAARSVLRRVFGRRPAFPRRHDDRDRKAA